jgi:hypothetical protein
VNLLDIKNFRKVEESTKHFTLEHPSGHRLDIAKKGLSSDARKQLEEMPINLAKGGHAKWAQANDPNMKGAKAAKPSKSTNTMPGSPTDSSKSFTEPPEMGTSIPRAELQEEMTNGQQPDVVLQSLNRKAPPFGPLSSAPKQHYPPCINPSCKSYGKSHPNCLCYGGNSQHSGTGEAGHFAEGGEVEKEYYCDNNRPHFKKCEYYAEGGDVKDDKLSEGEKLDLAKQAVAQEAPQGSSPPPDPGISIPERSPASAQDVQQPQQVDPTDMPDNKNVSTPGPSYNAQGENISDPLTQFQATKDAHMQEMLNDSGTFNNEVNQGQIKPEHYFHLFGRTGDDGQPTTLGKIGTAFGLMLGGIGSGLTHQPNAALTVMQNEIDNDLKAQEMSSQNKQNFLKINQQGFLNRAQEAQMSQDTKTKAYALTKMQMNYAALHSLVQNASKLPPGSPQRQQADQQLAMMNQGVQNENFSIADRAATASALGSFMNGGNGTNTTLMKTGLLGPEAREAGDDIEQKTIPGIPGRAQRPIPQQTRDQVQNMNVLDAKAKDLIDYAKAHEGSWNPQTRAVAQQKANEMVGFYSSSLGTSMTEGTRTWLDDQIAKKNPTSVIAQELMGSNSRLKEIQNSNNMRRSTLLGSVGLKGPQEQEMKKTKQSSQDKKTSNSGREMYQKNGKWYYSE